MWLLTPPETPQSYGETSAIFIAALCAHRASSSRAPAAGGAPRRLRTKLRIVGSQPMLRGVAISPRHCCRTMFR